MDRYIFDFTVDQSINFNLSTSEMDALLKKSKVGKMLAPEYIIIIDIPAEVGYKRKMDGTSINYLEQRESLYSSLEGNNIVHIDGSQDIDKIKHEIISWIMPRIEGGS